MSIFTVEIPPDAKGLQVESDANHEAVMSFYFKKDGMWFRSIQKGMMNGYTFTATGDAKIVAVQKPV